FGTSAKASAAAFEEEARASEELDRRVAALRAQIDPLGAAQNRLNAELAEYNELAARGVISSEELAKAQVVARQRYEAYASEMQRQQKRGVGGLPGYQLTNLMYQGTDVLQSFALGMPIQQVLIQQGPQIAQIFAANGAAMKGLVSSIGATTVAITGVVAAVALGAKAFNDYLVSMKAVESASDGLGRATAGTSAQMEAAARAGADAANISIKSARSMESQFLRTGRIGSDNFEALIAISRDFAATIGVDSDKVGETLANMFADPAKAAQALYQQYGLINAAVARQAMNLAAQNRQSEAQALLLNALPDRLARAEEATTALGRAWHGVAEAASNAWDAIGRAVDRTISGPSIEERMQDAQGRYDRFSNQSWLLRTLNGGQENADAARAELDDLQEQIRRRNQLEFEQRRRAAEIARSRAATGLADTSGANADLIQQERLRNEIAALRSGLGAEGVDDARVNSAIEAKTRVLDALINRQQRTAELDRLEIQIQNERNPLLRAELEARRARLQMADQEVSAARISEESQRTRNRVVSETMATASANVRDMRSEIETRQRLNAQLAAGTITSSDANRMLQEEAALRPLVLAAAVAEGEEKKALTGIIEQLRQSHSELAAEAKRSAAISVIQGQSDQLEMLRAEISLVGQSAEARQKYIAVLEAEQRIRREGLSGAEADQIRQQAAELAMLRSALARANFNDNLSFEERQFGRSSRDQQIASRLRGAGLSEDLTGFEATRMRSLMQMQEIKESVTSFFTDFRQAMVSNGGNIGKSLAQAISNGLMNEANKIWDRLAEQFGSLLAKALTGGTSGGTGIASTGIIGAVVGKAIGTNANAAPAVAANDNVASGVGQEMGMVGRYRGAGVDSRLTDILQTAATRFPGFKVDAISGYRAGDPRFHGQGLATDVQLTDLATGKMLGNYQDASSFRAYEQFAQVSRQIQMEKYPELADKFRWGGYFSGGPGKYGALDTMHFDLGGAGMAGGSWAGGLTTAQASLWPGIQSQGMEASKALERLAANTNVASKGLDSLGGGLGQLGQSLSGMQFSSTSGAAAGQFGGLWGGIGKLFGGISPTSPLWAPNTTFGAFLGLSSGGYTGPGGVNEARGIVHAGEVVWSQHDIARAGGVGVVEAMRLGTPGYADGGIVADRRRPVASAARADWNSRTDRLLSAANNNAGKSNGKTELHVHIDGANGDDHVREITRQGVQEALSDYAISQRRGGFGSMQNRWANQKG
ncbi:MAG TPA: phage tail length tape measure family protein, partial [Rhizobium sp.]|nr:phage tail length tape measure family protein [Rhizobium sp.]